MDEGANCELFGNFGAYSDAGVHREVAKFVANLSNQISAFKEASSEVALLANLKSPNEMSEGGVGMGAKFGAGPSYAGDFSS